MGFDLGEAVEDVFCAAAPVRDELGHVVAAISISAPVNRFHKHRDEYAHSVKTGAADISRAPPTARRVCGTPTVTTRLQRTWSAPGRSAPDRSRQFRRSHQAGAVTVTAPRLVKRALIVRPGDSATASVIPPVSTIQPGLELAATLAERVGGERQGLGGMAEYRRPGRRIRDIPVDLQQAGFQAQVEHSRGTPRGPTTYRPDEALSAVASASVKL